MLTPGEISERRKARRLLEHKRIALQEAVERKVCEGIYDRIWRHKGTLDQIEDEKLRSKTAALALVGIGLKELGIDMGSSRNNGMTSADRLGQVEESIFKASESLVRMNESRNPLGKLQRLATTHQIIVDLLSNIHQSSSSADEILPTLIYTLIISPAEGINVISNLRFIQRFRSANKIDGEAAYCLTNLEAAITFLETVDLATLQTDEVLEETPRPIQTAPLMEEFQDPLTSNAITQAVASSPVTTPLTAVPTHISAGQPRPFHIPPPPDSHTTSSPPVSPSQQRRLSSLFQPPVGAFGAASDAVRNTADQGFRSVGTALDSSFKLLFGRLKEQHVQGTGSDHGTIIVPKTLDDARRLVSPKPLIDEDGNISEASSFTEQDEPTPREDRLLEMITGTRQLRDRSVDSAQSNSSNSRRLAFLAEGKSTPSSGIAASPAVSTPTSAVDSMRSLGNTLNPLNRLAGINVMRGFGRSSTTPPALANPAAIPTTDGGKDLKGEIFSPGRIQAPIQKFLDVGDAGELKLSDVEALLKDYQRLAGVVKGMGLC